MTCFVARLSFSETKKRKKDEGAPVTTEKRKPEEDKEVDSAVTTQKRKTDENINTEKRKPDEGDLVVPTTAKRKSGEGVEASSDAQQVGDIVVNKRKYEGEDDANVKSDGDGIRSVVEDPKRRREADVGSGSVGIKNRSKENKKEADASKEPR